MSTLRGPESCVEMALLAVEPPGVHISRKEVDDCKKWLHALHARQEVISIPLGGQLFIDGAHTVDSLREAATWFAGHARKNSSERVLIFGVTKDRDYREFLRVLDVKN